MRIEINIYNSNGSKVIIVIRLVLLREKGDFQNINTSSTAQGVGGSFKKRKTIGEIGCCESRMSKQKH